MKTLYTPGPWQAKTVYANNAPNEIKIFPRGWVAPPVAYCGIDTPENAANARLLAAAPDMLDALKWAEDELASYAPDPNCRSEITQTILTKVRVAISKATIEE